MFSHVLHIRCTYTSHRHYIRFTHVNVYVSYASFAQIAYVAHAVYICFACVKQLGYVCVPLVRLCQAPIDGNLEAFWDWANSCSYYWIVLIGMDMPPNNPKHWPLTWFLQQKQQWICGSNQVPVELSMRKSSINTCSPYIKKQHIPKFGTC